MKILLAAALFFISYTTFGQQSQPNTFFAQGMITIESPEAMETLSETLRANPYVKVVRLDWLTRKIFVLTKDIDQLSLESFKSWFGEYEDNLNCVQIGVYGIDRMNAFPFTNCEN